MNLPLRRRPVILSAPASPSSLDLPLRFRPTATATASPAASTSSLSAASVELFQLHRISSRKSAK